MFSASARLQKLIVTQLTTSTLTFFLRTWTLRGAKDYLLCETCGPHTSMPSLFKVVANLCPLKVST